MTTINSVTPPSQPLSFSKVVLIVFNYLKYEIMKNDKKNLPHHKKKL